MKTNFASLPVYGVPLLGLTGLIVCLWHPQITLRTEPAGQETVCLLNPNPQLDKAMTIFLRQEAKNVAESRNRRSLKAQAETVTEYNLIAQECTPAVFESTHLPPAMTL